MACGTCGQRRQQMTQEAAAAVVSNGNHPKPVYIVTDPAGKAKEFSDYGLAAIHREKTNGTMTTTTAS
jgi:hypothetical protein